MDSLGQEGSSAFDIQASSYYIMKTFDHSKLHLDGLERRTVTEFSLVSIQLHNTGLKSDSN